MTRYIALGVALLAFAAGAVYLLQRRSAPAPVEASNARPAAAAPVDDGAGPTLVQRDQLVEVVGEVRRLAADGRFDEADAELKKADSISSNWAETEKARDEIAELRTPQGRLVAQLERARLAIDHGDLAAAEAALAEAERLTPGMPQIAGLHRRFEQAALSTEHRNEKVADLLARMRRDIARGDFAAADGDLNAAERVDVTDPALAGARRELAQAREARSRQSQ